ncbi:efflux transporter outer membrane subunit [Halobacteriovorax sp. ZH4_bin.1]|uniref:efflux transporter outer membrane subunit n=1 Tax=unclassified Halobacteriovorax TaxID=2639665 RepID=UPI003718ADDC
MSKLSLSIFLIFLFGCAVGPKYKRPDMPAPSKYRYDTSKKDIQMNEQWWEIFNDKQLSKLVAIGLKQNFDIKIALARIEEAAAFYGFKKKELYPLFNYQGNFQKGNYSQGALYPNSVESSFLAASVQWEIDFWGKLRNANEAARGQLLSTTYAYDSVRLQVSAAIATAYFQLLKNKVSLKISKATVETREESYRIVKARFTNGTVSKFDLNQAQAQLSFAKASVPRFERAIIASENLIRILLGYNPGKLKIKVAQDITQALMVPNIPIGIPSDVLRRRPDVAQAEASLRAQNAEIGVAEANLFPTISLTGTAGNSDSSFNPLSGEFIWNLGANLIGPLFQWGRNLDLIDVEKAQYKQLLYSYKLTVLGAFRDVEDSLVAVNTINRESINFREQVFALREAKKISLNRYNNGVTSFLEVLDSERALFESELNYVSVKQDNLIAYVNLYKALGGGWELKEEVTSEKAN